METSPIRIEPVVSEFFAENAYILWRQGDSRAVVVDPGFNPELIIDLLSREGLTPDAVLLTHGHSDHIAGNQAMKDQWPDCPLIIGHGDAYKLTDPVGNLSANFGIALVSPPADQTVREGDSIEIAGIEFQTLETPGHSAGHVVFLYESDGQTHLLGGDVLFQGGVGRTDFADGSFDDLRASIHDKLFPLPDDTVVYPGHGPTTTIGEEKQSNPYIGRAAGFDL